jgi:hypothetical protein
MRPSMAMVPLAGRTSPERACTKVLFPAPFGPTSATISPSATDRLTPSNAVTAPQRTIRSVARSMILVLAGVLADVGRYHRPLPQGRLANTQVSCLNFIRKPV